ncbi:hypothetical protein WR25_12926 [Diploscapter pachys]|uniref:Uncharacterized protein n=1 Tax=Diploscapter pachys TaxID=2018661 RepID=A0A2A2JHS8_9BILA|nr:hypothetical protein WR25_12926 [Diploscapter pachys]
MTISGYVEGRNHGEYIVNPNEDGEQADGGFMTGAKQKVDGLRNWMAARCCGCFKNIPSIVVLIGLCLLLALLLALIPLLFLLLGSGAESQKLVDLNIMRSNHNWTDLAGKKSVESQVKEEVKMNDEDKNKNTGKTMARKASKMEWASSILAIGSYPTAKDIKHCQGFGFHCVNEPSKVVSSSLRCDGISDCGDGSDEENCLEIGMPRRRAQMWRTGSVSAAGGPVQWNQRLQGRMCRNGKCIAASKMGDGKEDCSDGSDEKECDCLSCSGSEVALCGDGTCISRDKICNGHADCSDAMDEKNCPGTCERENKEEISLIRCSDDNLYPLEEACRGELEQCQSDCKICDQKAAFACTSQHKCIPQSKVCNGLNDCKDGEDEEDCEAAIFLGNSFKCAKGDKIISAEQRCDGIWHCEDHSDEMNCHGCLNLAIHCGYNCVPSWARCDGVAHCLDGSDERDCSCDECIGQHSTTYMCENSARCLPREQVCAPYSTCPNATDSDVSFCARFALTPQQQQAFLHN